MAENLRIAFIGGGGVNFGGAEGPWDHASRLERMEGLAVVGVADPDLDKAQKALAAREAGPYRRLYQGAKAFGSERQMLDAAKPAAVFIGVPPFAHGSTKPPHDIELVCASAGVHMFIEKPLSVLEPAELSGLAAELAKAGRRGLIISVGYMFRYSKAVAKMQDILAGVPGGPKAVLARYDCAYSQINKAAWWDIRRSGGPIVEQATHLCDLARLLAGEVEPGSVSALAIPGGRKIGQLVDMPRSRSGRSVEEDVPPRYRVPRATVAVWRHKSGAVGSLSHGALLHGQKYSAELEVWGDGLRMVLSDPYGACRLSVRYPHAEQTEVMEFTDDDPYLTEDAAFIQAIRTGSAEGIRSSYADALKTYEFTWAIRRAAEK